MYVILRRMRPEYAVLGLPKDQRSDPPNPWVVGDERVFLDWDEAKKVEELLQKTDAAMLKAWEFAVYPIKDGLE